MYVAKPGQPGSIHQYTCKIAAPDKVDAYTGSLLKRMKKAQMGGTGIRWRALCFGEDSKAAWMKRLDDMGLGANVVVTKEGPGVAIVVLELGVDATAKLNVPNVPVSTMAVMPKGQPN